MCFCYRKGAAGPPPKHVSNPDSVKRSSNRILFMITLLFLGLEMKWFKLCCFQAQGRQICWLRTALTIPTGPSLSSVRATLPYHTIPYHTIPYHTLPYHTIPYHGCCYREHNRMRPVFGTSFICALMFLDNGVAGAIDGAVGVPYHGCCCR